MIIDSNIFLELFLQQERMESCNVFLNKTFRGEINGFISDFSVDSVLLIMEKNKTSLVEMKKFLQNLLNSEGIKIYFIHMNDRIHAINFIEKYGLDYEDALVLQSAISTKSAEIVSFDKHFDKVKEIKRIEP